MIKKAVFYILIIIVFIIILFTPLFPRLVLNNVKNNTNNVILKVDNKKFIISYMHSVNKSKIRDFYFINKNNDIVLEKTRFVSYGAGIPEPKEGESFIISDDYMEINNMNRTIKDLYLFVGTIANHTVMTGDKITELNKFFIPKTNIKIEYKKVSIFDLIISFVK